MKYTKLMEILSEVNRDKQTIIIYLKDGLVFKSSHNTGVFESDNGEDLDADEYLEYYACALETTEILTLSYTYNQIKNGDLIEISELNEPLKIELSDNQVIWKKQ